MAQWQKKNTSIWNVRVNIQRKKNENYEFDLFWKENQINKTMFGSCFIIYHKNDLIWSYKIFSVFCNKFKCELVVKT